MLGRHERGRARIRRPPGRSASVRNCASRRPLPPCQTSPKSQPRAAPRETVAPREPFVALDRPEVPAPTAQARQRRRAIARVAARQLDPARPAGAGQGPLHARRRTCRGSHAGAASRTRALGPVIVGKYGIGKDEPMRDMPSIDMEAASPRPSGGPGTLVPASIVLTAAGRLVLKPMEGSTAPSG